jgi:hypothetical protein
MDRFNGLSKGSIGWMLEGQEAYAEPSPRRASRQFGDLAPRGCCITC